MWSVQCNSQSWTIWPVKNKKNEISWVTPGLWLLFFLHHPSGAGQQYMEVQQSHEYQIPTPLLSSLLGKGQRKNNRKGSV